MAVWRIGVCANCLEVLSREEVKLLGSPFCSRHCEKQAEMIRYLGRVIRDGRILDPFVRHHVRANNLRFLRLDLAYTRPRLPDDLRRKIMDRTSGLCAECESSKATEIDHVSGGSNDLDNLRALCAVCHRKKDRGPIPSDLTRSGNASIDDSDESGYLENAWTEAILSGEVLSDSPEWEHLRELSSALTETRFGWLTQQVLVDEPISPAHRDDWKSRWRSIRARYREWALSSS